jgi:hypothetical protein
MTATVQERIERSIEKNTNDCWIWKLARTKQGYGRIAHNNKSCFAHRVSYQTYVGDIPEGLVLDHVCRTRECVNPEHLEAVTFAENIRRGARGVLNPQRQATHCKWGHEFNEKNTYWKTSESGSKSRMCITCKNRRKTKAWKNYRGSNCL